MSGVLHRETGALPHAGIDGAATGASEPPARSMLAQGGDCSQPDEPSLGELKARHRELHLCLRCTHHMVCGMAKALDANLLVTIVTCLAFEPEGSEDANDMCELLPVEPLPTT